MKSIIKTLVVIFIITLFTNCASIVSHTKWPLSVNSSPSGAKVEITNKKGDVVFKGETPASTELKSGAGFFSSQSYQVKISMEGYADRVIPVGCNVNGWYIAGNFFIGGLIGWLIVDPATGAMYRLDTDNINVPLSKLTSSTEPVLKIMNINDIPENLKNKLICIK